MTNQRPVQAVGDAPKEKQAANKGEGQKVSVSGAGLRMVGHAIFVLLPAMLEKKYFPDVFFRKLVMIRLLNLESLVIVQPQTIRGCIISP